MDRQALLEALLPGTKDRWERGVIERVVGDADLDSLAAGEPEAEGPDEHDAAGYVAIVEAAAKMASQGTANEGNTPAGLAGDAAADFLKGEFKRWTSK